MKSRHVRILDTGSCDCRKVASVDAKIRFVQATVELNLPIDPAHPVHGQTGLRLPEPEAVERNLSRRVLRRVRAVANGPRQGLFSVDRVECRAV